MIAKNDCMSILVKMEDDGNREAGNYLRKLIVSKDVPLDVLKFIWDNKGIEIGNFYEMLRKKHNQKKSPLYINIVREQDTVEEIITTLTCLLTQIVLYSNKLEDSELFLKEIRAEEITRVLNTYFKTGEYADCVTLLRLIKIDLLVLEGIRGRREFE